MPVGAYYYGGKCRDYKAVGAMFYKNLGHQTQHDVADLLIPHPICQLLHGPMEYYGVNYTRRCRNIRRFIVCKLDRISMNVCYYVL